MQKNISLYKGKKYKASFDLTSEYQTYTLEFEMTEENNLSAMITFSMGAINGEVITDSHVIFIDNIVLEEQ